MCSHGRFTYDFLYKDVPKIKTPEIDIAFMLDPSTGKSLMYKPKKGDSPKINSLEEMLKGIDKADRERKVWLNIEIKDNDEEMLKETHRLLKLYKRDSLTIWGHVDDQTSQKLAEIDPEIKRMASPEEVHKIFMLFWTGFLPFSDIKF